MTTQNKTKNKKTANNLKRVYIKRTYGQRMSAKVSKGIGSWTFILSQTALVLTWIFFAMGVFRAGWDSPSFIILNLILSIIAAFSAPIILMSQNMEAERDRKRAMNDLTTDRRTEKELLEVHKLLKRVERKISTIQKKK